MAFKDLRTTTVREFDGGLNVVNDDLNMDTRFSKVEINMFNNINGTKAKRYGTQFLKDIKTYDIVEETFENVETNSKYYLTLLYDKSFDVNRNSSIRLVHEDGQTSTDTLIKSYSTSTIVIENVFSLTEQGDIIGYQVYNSTDKTWSETYECTLLFINDSKDIQLSKPIYHQIVKNDKIIITSPETLSENLLNKKFTITSVNNNSSNLTYFRDKNTITIDISDAELNKSDEWFNGDKIIYNLVDEKFNRASSGELNNNAYYSKVDSLKILVNENSDLIAGHTIDIYLNEDYSGTKYTQTISEVVIEGEGSDKKKYLIINNIPDELKNQNKLYVKHDNRNIKGNRIINVTYYIDKLILVSDIGEVVAVDGQMNAIIIWNDLIAKTVNPEQDINGWHDTTSVCFTVFNGILTAWNGVDKPLAIDLNNQIPCNFLYDEGTGSNAFVPIAKYAIAFNHYLVCGNIFDETEGIYLEDKISISSKDAIGTFYSGDQDDLSNDAVELRLGTTISSNKQIIKGLSRYRDRLVVGFDEVSVFGVLGNYTELVVDEEEGTTRQVHTPQFEDVIDNNGCICNRSYASINTELICLDYSGVPLFKRTGIYSTIMPGRISNLIAPELYSSFIGLKEKTVEDKIFSVNNPKENQYLLFIPNNDEYDDITEYICYAYTINNNNKQSATSGAWSKFTGWNFQCGCTSALNDVYLINKTKIYLLGSINNPIYADYVDDPDYPVTDNEPSGKEIEFDWEFPWADFGDRSATKHSRYLAISSTGNSEFNIDFFIDYIYYNNYYNKLDPQLTMNFLAGDSNGWGNGKQNYGGGRITNNELLFAWTTKFKIAKFRLHGASKYKLNINSITLYYQMGNIRR